MPFEVIPQPLPIITDIDPVSAGAGATITITGTNLASTNRVTVNGATAGITTVAATSVEFVIPTGASTGTVVLRTSAGEATSYLTVIPPSGSGGSSATAYPLTITTDGQTVFNLPVTVADATKVGVYVNTTRQIYGVDWTASATTLTWIGTDLTLKTTDKLEILI